LYVYALTNRVNGKVYIGIHEGELAEYLVLNCGRALGKARAGDKPHLYRAIRKHGRESFGIRSLVNAIDREQAGSLEKFFIRTLETRNPEIGYNLAEGGTGGATRWGKHKPESIEKMRLAQVGIPKSKIHRQHLSTARLGVKCPEVANANRKRRSATPSLGAIRNRRYRERLKEKSCQILNSIT
jgi:hypothetical protein